MISGSESGEEMPDEEVEKPLAVIYATVWTGAIVQP